MTSSSTWPRPVDPPPAIRVPTVPGETVRAPFPLLATVAPVLASVGIWSITQSPFALVFALLGPVVALAALGDASWQGGRRRRRDLERFEDDALDVEATIRDRQSVERVALDTAFPLIRHLVGDRGIDEAWQEAGAAVIRVGTGDAPSPIRLDGPVIRHPDERIRTRLVTLESSAGWLPDSALVVDAADGIGYCGPELARTAAARAGVIRLAMLHDPSSWMIRTSAPDRSIDEWRWIDALPHRRIHDPVGSDSVVRIEFVPVADRPRTPVDVGDRIAFAVLAPTHEELPRRCGSVLALEAGAGTLTVRGSPRRLRPEFASADEARQVAQSLAARARRMGLHDDERDLVGEVALSSLTNVPSPSSQGLACEAGCTANGAWVIDLVADGPHAVIGGVTGSGKSELLTSWLLAMAARHTPDEVTFLLVDFKGGATFGAVSLLPHSVGLITDLDRVQARRALDSLRAELRFRESTIAGARARSIDELEKDRALARLIIVVDEFQALAGDFPELRELFSDLAARGRSLGIHLILCTQRPAATLRDAILANCTLRICLRVNDPADSIALLGTGAAAALPRAPVGRALVSTGGERPTLVQVAIAALDDSAAAARTEAFGHPVRRPWCDPLPAIIDLADLDRVGIDPGDIAIGMLDLPESQRQMTAVWRPRSHGNLLVLGGFGSGKSTTLGAIAAGSERSVTIPSDVEGAWDGVLDAVGTLERTGADCRFVLVDDIDALIGRFSGDHQREFIDALAKLIRDGPARGTFTVASARSVPAALHQIASACDSRVLLRMPDRSEHVVAGGRGADFDERMAPGGGYFRGERVQVGWLPARPPPLVVAPEEIDFPPGGVTAVVSTAPREFVAEVGASGGSVAIRVIDMAGSPGAGDVAVSGRGEHLLLVGDPDAWQAAWARLPAIRAQARILFHLVSVADYRAIARSRRLPPALSGDPAHVWVLDRDDTVRRALVPARPPRAPEVVQLRGGPGADQARTSASSR